MLGARAEWDFRNAASTWELYRPYTDLTGKTVLDVGCAAGGKPTYYALQGARHVTAIDVDGSRIEAAREFARSKGVPNVAFEVQNAAALPYETSRFDLVVFNDSFEHVDDPAGCLREAYRVLRTGGTVHIAFPPYRSPWGAHLFAHIRIPWAPLFFEEGTLVRLWQEREERSAPGAVLYAPARAQAMTSAVTVRTLGHLNGMTLSRLEQLVAATPFTTLSLRLRTPGNALRFAARQPQLREYVVTRAVAVLAKRGGS